MFNVLRLRLLVVSSFVFLLGGCSMLASFLPDSAAKPMESKMESEMESGSEMSTKSDIKPVRADLPDFGAAPEINNPVWLNTAGEKPLRLADLRGKVVLLNFWTFGCYNCKNVLPYVRQWHDNYTDQGLVVIGVHFPEFAYEADLNNLRDATKRLDVAWAVAQDNDGLTWRSYNQRYWPTIYLIDKQGHIRYQRIGEGAYNQTESAIKALLSETY